MVYSICPECDHKVDVGEDPEIGSHLFCETCLADLVVTWLNPIELMIIDKDDYPQNDADSFSENFQKIRKKKGETHASWKTQEKHQEIHRNQKKR
jgi:hypothetical protein